MKTAFILAACLVACLFFLEAHGKPRRPPGDPPGPPPVNETGFPGRPRGGRPPGDPPGPPPVNETGFPGRPRGGRPPGPPRGRPFSPLNETDVSGRPRPGKPPGGPRRPPFTLGNETVDFNETSGPGKRFRGGHDVNRTKEFFATFFAVKYSWFWALDANTTVKEGAGIRNGSKLIFEKSIDPQLESKGYNKTSVTYDFTNDTAIVIYSFFARFAPCFVENTAQTFEEVSNDVESKNGSTIESTNKVTKTAAPLSEEEEAALRESNSILNFVCRFRQIFRLAPASAGDQPSDTNTEKVVFHSGDAVTTVTYPKPTGPRAGGKPGKEGKGGRGGKRGQGPRRGFP